MYPRFHSLREVDRSKFSNIVYDSVKYREYW